MKFRQAVALIWMGVMFNWQVNNLSLIALAGEEPDWVSLSAIGFTIVLCSLWTFAVGYLIGWEKFTDG